MLKRIVWMLTLLLAAGAAQSLAQTCHHNIPESAPDSRYSNNGNGTVTDQLTGLIWKQCPEGLGGNGCASGAAVSFDWQQALRHADTAVFARFSDWRLPNKNELLSLVEQRCADPAINSRFFPRTPARSFWSSSPLAHTPGLAWDIDFQDGSDGYSSMGSRSHVRLVRDEP